MGYTHYWDYRNPVVEMTQTKIKKDAIRDQNRGNWEKIEKEWDKLPTEESYVKRIAKHLKAFKSISEDIKKALANLPARFETARNEYDEPIVLRGGNGQGEPETTDEGVWFNGDKSADLDHEAFALNVFEMHGYRSQSEMAEKGVFGFCKTARKPYDFVVCVSLMIIKHHLGKDFSVSSDGSLSDWKPAIEYYESLFRRKAPKQLMNYFKREEQAIA